MTVVHLVFGSKGQSYHRFFKADNRLSLWPLHRRAL